MLIHRSQHYLSSIGARSLRLLSHVCFSSYGVHQSRFKKITLWLPGIFILLLDLLALPEIYDYLSNMLKRSSRPLTVDEIETARSVYRDAFAYEQLRIDDRAVFGPKYGHFAYVSYFTINCYGRMTEQTFIHELMHIWQYQKYGSMYILHALWAQQTKENYNYGGLAKLMEAKRAGRRLAYFNFEQQADIIEDYYLIKNGCRPQWGSAGPEDLIYYEYFLNEVKL